MAVRSVFERCAAGWHASNSDVSSVAISKEYGRVEYAGFIVGSEGFAVSDTWEHLAQPYENGRDALCTADDKAYGGDDEYDACHVAQGKDFAEDRDPENDGGDGLQGTEDGGGGGADVVYGSGGAKERYGGG